MRKEIALRRAPVKACRLERTMSIVACALLIAVMAYVGNAFGEPAEQVRFQSGGVTLSGTVFYPPKSPAATAVVLVHGSGKVPRMAELAKLLASDGVIVLTYDKRGVGESGGIYEGRDNVSATNLELLAADASAALHELRSQPRARGIASGYLGISQAGWVVPIAALKTSSPAFIALWSGPVCTVSEELHFSVWAEKTPDFWKSHSSGDVAAYMKSVPHRVDDVDPSESLSRLHVPGLWLYGGRDTSIPVDLSIGRLQSLIAEGHPFEYKVFVGEGHNLADSAEHESYRFMIEWLRKLAVRLPE